MKYIIFAVAIVEALVIAQLTVMMRDRSFNNRHMSYAYKSGCYLSQMYVHSTKFTCDASADNYKKELDELDVFFDELGK